MKLISLDIDTLPLLVSDFLLGRIVMSIEYGLDLESTLGRGMPDVLQDNLIGYEWLRSPVDVDEGEHLMLNGVPLAGSWWVMTHVES
jgi:hypothetical protein